jgi:hypothetical protein
MRRFKSYFRSDLAYGDFDALARRHRYRADTVMDPEISRPFAQVLTSTRYIKLGRV